MDNIINVLSSKENTLEFDISIDGISDKDIITNFCIKTKDLVLSFPCTKKEKNTWNCSLIKLNKIIEETSYQFFIEVIVDGYYFKPHTGSINVTKSHDVYITKPKNTTLEPEDIKVVEPKKETTKKDSDSKKSDVKSESILSIANKILSEATPKETEITSEINIKDEAAKKVLKNLGFDIKTKPKAKSKFSIKNI